jgi:hypothetical protein
VVRHNLQACGQHEKAFALGFWRKDWEKMDLKIEGKNEAKEMYLEIWNKSSLSISKF